MNTKTLCKLIGLKLNGGTCAAIIWKLLSLKEQLLSSM